jgi:hypothetical protein
MKTLIVAIVLALCVGWRVLAENVPKTTPLFYAGVLEENGQLVDGERSITLTAWDRETDGNVLCTSTTDKLAVSAGNFRVALSEACVLELRGADKPADVWFSVTFKDAGGTPHDIPGRTKVGAVPFALKSERAASAEAASGALLGQLVPTGMIAMFAGACPGGWSEYAALRGRVPRGEPAGNAGSLDMGGSDDAVVVSHTHAGMTGGGAHKHAGTTAAQNQKHTHSGTTGGNYAWNSCDIYDSGGDTSAWQPGVWSAHYIGGNCAYRDKTLHVHGFDTGTESADHAHAFSVEGGEHAHSFTTGDASGAAKKDGANMQAFKEVIFCVKN